MIPPTSKRRRKRPCIIPLPAGVNTIAGHHTQKQSGLAVTKAFSTSMEESGNNLEDRMRSALNMSARRYQAFTRHFSPSAFVKRFMIDVSLHSIHCHSDIVPIVISSMTLPSKVGGCLTPSSLWNFILILEVSKLVKLLPFASQSEKGWKIAVLQRDDFLLEARACPRVRRTCRPTTCSATRCTSRITVNSGLAWRNTPALLKCETPRSARTAQRHANRHAHFSCP